MVALLIMLLAMVFRLTGAAPARKVEQMSRLSDAEEASLDSLLIVRSIDVPLQSPNDAHEHKALLSKRTIGSSPYLKRLTEVTLDQGLRYAAAVLFQAGTKLAWTLRYKHFGRHTQGNLVCGLGQNPDFSFNDFRIDHGFANAVDGIITQTAEYVFRNGARLAVQARL
ncbi:hypothetical protein IWZ03DRAFT_357254 [Phyllosticta citriasiana]|uniref:Uncharacterized protein n=1 Tax=Phyllosticta citriasiana TaxID=595635 RepID=A0ABR1KTY7_9PEZI